MSMAKSKKRNPDIRRPQADPVPKRTVFVPNECSACTALRPTGQFYARVTATIRGDIGIMRYCRCGFCGNTWKQIENRPA